MKVNKIVAVGIQELLQKSLLGGFNLDEEPVLVSARTRTIGFDINSNNYALEILEVINSSQELPETVVMAGTLAYHSIGDVSRVRHSFFYAERETTDYWIGRWVSGLSFLNTVFPKDTSKHLSDKGQESFNKIKGKYNVRFTR